MPRIALARSSAVVAALLGPAAAVRADPAAVPSFASPMVDPSLFRDGAVRRSTGRFGFWTVTCDEVAGLNQRFCSLKAAAARNPYGQTVAVDVSTDDDGRPAALLHLPLAVSVPFGVRVATAPRVAAPGRGRRIAPTGRTVAIARCDARECLAVLSLAPSDLTALDGGAGLTLTTCATRPGGLEFATDLARSGCAVRLASPLSGAGFRAAVQASLR